MHTVEVCNKKNVPDVFGCEVKGNIRETGVRGIEEVLTSEIYHFEGISSLKELKRIAEEILVDAISQDYFTDDSDIEKTRDEYIIIDVFYRKGVTDAVADTVIIAAKDAGVKAGISVSMGRRYYLKGKLTDRDIETICEKVLVNPLVQEYTIMKGKCKNA